MIKYFHELTKEGFGALVEQEMTYKECAELYPQPSWCSYPDAIYGEMGCMSLTSFRIKDWRSCCGCECFKPRGIWQTIAHKWFRYKQERVLNRLRKLRKERKI